MGRCAGRATLTALLSVGLLAAGPLLVGLLDGASPVGAATPATLNPTDPYFGEQWALQAIHAPQAWARSTGAGVRIGIVDTGVDLQHEDLVGKIVASTNCIGSDGVKSACHGSAADDNGHGTDVAGIAAAETDNAKGVAGVAPDADLVVVKALGATGNGALNDVNAGIEWAVDHGAKVVNLSLEADGASVAASPGQSLAVGVDYAWRHGAIAVVAAGNATPSLLGPTGYAGLDAVIVGATGPSDEVAWYSSPLDSAQWGLVAPGGDSRDPATGAASCAGALAAGCVVSTGWFPGHVNQYAEDEGTSMATPQVSGVLALLLGSGLTPAEAVARLLSTADKIACGTSCHGLVDAGAAVGPPGAAVRMAPLALAPAAKGPPVTTTRAPAPAGSPAAPTAPHPVAPVPAVGANPGGSGGPAAPTGTPPPTRSAPTGPTSPTVPTHRAAAGTSGRTVRAPSSSLARGRPVGASGSGTLRLVRWSALAAAVILAALGLVALARLTMLLSARRRIFD